MNMRHPPAPANAPTSTRSITPCPHCSHLEQSSRPGSHPMPLYTRQAGAHHKCSCIVQRGAGACGASPCPAWHGAGVGKCSLPFGGLCRGTGGARSGLGGGGRRCGSWLGCSLFDLWGYGVWCAVLMVPGACVGGMVERGCGGGRRARACVCVPLRWDHCIPAAPPPPQDPH